MYRSKQTWVRQVTCTAMCQEMWQIFPSLSYAKTTLRLPLSFIRFTAEMGRVEPLPFFLWPEGQKSNNIWPERQKSSVEPLIFTISCGPTRCVTTLLRLLKFPACLDDFTKTTHVRPREVTRTVPSAFGLRRNGCIERGITCAAASGRRGVSGPLDGGAEGLGGRDPTPGRDGYRRRHHRAHGRIR
jgi:hypothetical protein